MKICILGSGSKGNAIYLESRGTALLIDQGFSHTEMKKRLESRGLDEGKIKGIIVSHEHIDHMKGVGITARKLDVPVYGTSGTLNGKAKIFNDGEDGETLVPIESGVLLKLDPFEILPFSVSHDANEPVQFCINSGKKKVTTATDLGFVSTLVEQCLKNSDLVVIEANHDVNMLRNGPYSWELKQRIMSRMGHLSNRNAAETLFNITSQNGNPQAVLAHISEENNHPELAEKEVRELFESFDRRLRSLIISSQSEATPILEL
ncbi:MBL fold metallo-hydrolase [Candidatus Latescibacterota bacterium]